MATDGDKFWLRGVPLGHLTPAPGEKFWLRGAPYSLVEPSTGVFTTRPTAWENIEGGFVDSGGGTLTYEGGGAYYARATTVEKIESGFGWLEFVYNATANPVTIGLHSGIVPAADLRAETTIFLNVGPLGAEVRTAGNVYQADISGALVGGEVFRIEIAGGKFNFYKNGLFAYSIAPAGNVFSYPYYGVTYNANEPSNAGTIIGAAKIASEQASADGSVAIAAAQTLGKPSNAVMADVDVQLSKLRNLLPNTRNYDSFDAPPVYGGIVQSRSFGVESGDAYVDLRWVGTATSDYYGDMPLSYALAAVPGESFAYQARIRKIAGTYPTGVVTYVAPTIADNVQYLGELPGAYYGNTLTTTPVDVSASGVTPAGTVFVNYRVQLFVPTGQTVDITVRVSRAQIERGTVPTDFQLVPVMQSTSAPTQASAVEVAAQAQSNLDAAQVTQGASQTASASVVATSTAAQVLGPVTQAAIVAVRASASAAQSTRAAGQVATVASIAALAGAQLLPSVQNSGTVASPVSVSGAQSTSGATNTSSVLVPELGISAVSAAQTTSKAAQEASIAVVQKDPANVSAAQATGAASQSAAATATVKAIIAQALSAATQTSSVGVGVAATGAQSLPRATQASSVGVSAGVAASQVQPAVVNAGLVKPSITATSTQLLAAATAVGEIDTVARLDAAQTLLPITQSSRVRSLLRVQKAAALLPF